MSVETLQPAPARQPKPAVTPTHVLAKGPKLFRSTPSSVDRKPSAVERLEADKAKYVKSQMALTMQKPARPPDLRKPLLVPPAALRPIRKAPLRPNQQLGGAPFDLENLTNLINGVSESSLPGVSRPFLDQVSASFPPQPPPVLVAQSPPPNWFSPVQASAPGPVRPGLPSAGSSPTSVTVRRVDVRPQTVLMRKPYRVQLQFPLPAQPPIHASVSAKRFLFSGPFPGHAPLQPVVPGHAPIQPVAPGYTLLPPATAPPATAPPQGAMSPSPGPAGPAPSSRALPPPSPAFTRLSSSSSRKRPSLTRSKSDASDRYSRAGTELERFFTLCGLDPADMTVLAGPASDIVSLPHLRSASAPGSECAAREQDEEEEGGATERTAYGLSVIERNARVIKWLYGLRQDKDTSGITNM